MHKVIWSELTFHVLLLILFVGCTVHRSYRPTAADYLPHRDGYQLGIIEFDDHGEFWQPEQVYRVLAALHAKNSKGGRVLVMVFIHGWKNDASPGNEKQSNLAFFDATLARIARTEIATAPSGQARSVFGIYLAWRGSSLNLPEPFSNLSFWDRLATATRISEGAAATQSLLAILAETNRNPYSRSIVIAHSMGALIVEKALTQALAAQVMIQGFAKPPDSRSSLELKLKFPTDLVILVNSAAPALYAKTLIDTLEAFNVVPSQPANPRLVHSISAAWRPLIVSVTSEHDNATGLAFPIGTTLGSLFQRFQSYAPSETMIANVPRSAILAKPSQRYFYTHTPGHVPELFSHAVNHRVVPERERTPNNSEVRGCEEFAELSTGPTISRDSDGDLCYEVNGNQFHIRRLRSDTGLNATPYWIMQVPVSIIPNHTAIFNNTAFEDMVHGLISVSNVLSPAAEEYKHLTWCMWHEGVRVYDDGDPGALRPLDDIRRDCIKKQGHNSPAQELLSHMSDDDFAGIIGSAVYNAEEDHSLQGNLDWVARHEGQIGTLAKNLDIGDFGAIRSVYFRFQQHNPDARNLLALTSNGQLRGMIQNVEPE